MTTAAIDPINAQGVGAQGGDVIVSFPEHRMTPTQALLHAAWLVTIAETTGLLAGQDLPTFDDVLEAVRNT